MPDRDGLVLAQRARLLAQPMAASGAADDDHHFLLFGWQSSGFAVPLAAAAVVRTIIDPQPVTGGPPWLRGLGAIAGRIVPVVDVRSYLTGEGTAEANHAAQRQLVVVIEADGAEAALAIETLDGIDLSPADAVRSLPAGTPTRVTQVAAGLLRNRLVLDPGRLVQELRTTFDAGPSPSQHNRAPHPAAGAGHVREGA